MAAARKPPAKERTTTSPVAPGTPPSAASARATIRTALATGNYELWDHLIDRAEQRDMNNLDVISVLRSGAVEEPPDLVHGSWRFRVNTPKMTVVVALTSTNSIAVITAWRKP